VTAPQAPLARPRSPATGELRGRSTLRFSAVADQAATFVWPSAQIAWRFDPYKTSGADQPSNCLQRRPVPRAPWHLMPSVVAATASASGPASAMVSPSRILTRRRSIVVLVANAGSCGTARGSFQTLALSNARLATATSIKFSQVTAIHGATDLPSQHTARRQAGQHRSAIAGRSRRRAFAGRQPLSRSLRCMCKPRLPPTHELLPGAPAIQIESRVRSVTRPGRVPKILALLLVWRFEAPMWADGVGIPASRGLENPGHADDFREDSHEVPSTS